MHDLSRLQRLRITAAHRLDWYRAMAKAIADGKSAFVVVQRLEAEYRRTSHPLAPLVRELGRRMAGTKRAGQPVGHVTLGADLVGLVPTNEANLIDAGEASGRLEDGFRRAADYLAATEKLRGEIVAPLKEPLFLILLLLGVLMFFSLEILPTFDRIAPRHAWPQGAQLYGKLADRAMSIALGIVVSFAGAAALFLRLAANWTGSSRVRGDRWMFPFTLLTRVRSAALLASLAGFIAAGVPFDRALGQLAATSDRYMRWIYGQLKASMRNAARPEDALCAVHIVDRSHHWMIRLYGDSTDFPGALRRISEEVIEHAILRTRRTFGVINLVLKATVALFIVWTMNSLFGVVQAVRQLSTQLPQ